MNITTALVIEALQHASDKQEEELLDNLNRGVESWAGIILGEIVDSHVTSMEEPDLSLQTESEINSEIPSDRSAI